MLHSRQGFTLIELSIVLVVIGLVVGSVLTGRDLISAAEVRAQISQIEKYNSAVNTFRSKFNAIPGDMTSASAQQYGFIVGSNCIGQAGGRDGNGLLEGWPAPYSTQQGIGETALFWQDLSSPAAGNLIEGMFPNGGSGYAVCQISSQAITVSGATIGNIFPNAKIGHSNYVYVYTMLGANWFAISAVTSNDHSGNIFSGVSITTYQSYSIDKKIDDGIPTSGNVIAAYLNGFLPYPIPVFPPNTNVSGGTASSCYDTTTSTYSITYNNGSGANCALSFKFQ